MKEESKKEEKDVLDSFFETVEELDEVNINEPNSFDTKSIIRLSSTYLIALVN